MDYFCDEINFNLNTVRVNDVVVEAALDSISVCLCRVSKLLEWSKGVLNIGFCKLHLSV